MCVNIKNNNNEDIPTTQKSWVYKLKCEECEIMYIGETGEITGVQAERTWGGPKMIETPLQYIRDILLK